MTHPPGLGLIDMDNLRFASLMSANQYRFHQAVVEWLADRLGRPCGLVVGTDPEVVDSAFLCGLPTAVGAGRLEPLAALVMAAERYQDRPVYFTDLVVRADHPAGSFADLRGVRFAFNERGSFSGYVAVLDPLVSQGEGAEFLGELVESGSHLASIELLLAGRVDATGIDSVVLDYECVQRPELSGRINVVDTLGPWPMPPVVANRALDPETRESIRAALVGMADDGEGRRILDLGLATRFASVTADDYRPLAEAAARVDLAAE